MKLGLFLLFAFSISMANAQKGKTVKKVKERTTQRADEAVDRNLDKGLDKIEEGISNIFKKKKKKEQTTTSAENETSTPPTKPSTNAESNSNGNNNSSNSSVVTTGGSSNNNTPPSNTTPIKSNSKFDFEPGAKLIQFDDFSRLAIGDFPAEYNSNTSGEIVSLSGKNGKWLTMTKNGCIVPDYMNKLPENFTLEMEVGINADPTNNYSGFGLNFSSDKDNLMKDMFFNRGNAVIYLHPGAATANVFVNPTEGKGVEISNEVPMPDWDVREGSNKNFAKLSIWRQKGRLRVYVNENKVFDVPRFFVETAPYNFAFFRSFFGDCQVYVTNIRYAVAAEDLRAKLLNEGKFSTTGITFNTNSDKIKLESKPVLDEIAALLNTNTEIKLKIVGHTDSDGDAKANIILSQKRAAAIKTALVNNYGIDAGRLLTDGKGETQPLNKNTNAEEKAANRRAEFIKI